MADTTHRGTCMCEGVVFEVHGKTDMALICHCNDCIQNSGSAFQITAIFNKEQVKVISGEDMIGNWTIKKTTSGSEKHKRFCTRCGCTLWTIPMKHNGEKIIVRTPLLENGLETFKPEIEIFASQRPSYLEPAKGIKSLNPS